MNDRARDVERVVKFIYAWSNGITIMFVSQVIFPHLTPGVSKSSSSSSSGAEEVQKQIFEKRKRRQGKKCNRISGSVAPPEMFLKNQLLRKKKLLANRADSETK